MHFNRTRRRRRCVSVMKCYRTFPKNEKILKRIPKRPSCAYMISKGPVLILIYLSKSLKHGTEQILKSE